MSDRTPLQRRSFLSRLALGATALGAVLGGNAALPALARAQDTAPKAGHPEDAWLDDLKGMHKVIYDATSIEHGSEAFDFAENFMTGNINGYKLKDSDLAIVVSFRHYATPFAFNDAIWAKYKIGAFMKFNDPKTKEPAVRNIVSEQAKALGARGVAVSVCALATDYFAGEAAKSSGAKKEDIFKELTSNLVVPNAHLMAAGVVAVNRAQEHGYSYTYVG